MKTVDYINTLIKEKEHLTALCKSHVETIRSIKRELAKLNSTITKKDMRIVELEGEIKTPINVMVQKELDAAKNELSQLRSEYDALLSKYNELKVQKAQRVSNKTKNELSQLKEAYDALQSKYDDVVKENTELKSIFDEIENLCESEEQ